MANFGVTATMVRTDKFPFWGDFSPNSNPTDTVVARFITQKYGELAAKLLIKGVLAATIDAAPSSVAYAWCQETLTLMVARRVLDATTARYPELAKAFDADLKVRLQSLQDYGATALGDATLQVSTTPPAGPTTHINYYDLSDPNDSTTLSTLDPPFRKDDKL